MNYGHTLNPAANAGLQPEGHLSVRYQPRTGHYLDGARWSLRVPRYEIGGLAYGALSPGTVLKPRMASALFGAGLLEAVANADIVERAQRSHDGIQGRVSLAVGRRQAPRRPLRLAGQCGVHRASDRARVCA